MKTFKEFLNENDFTKYKKHAGKYKQSADTDPKSIDIDDDGMTFVFDSDVDDIEYDAKAFVKSFTKKHGIKYYDWEVEDGGSDLEITIFNK